MRRRSLQPLPLPVALLLPPCCCSPATTHLLLTYARAQERQSLEMEAAPLLAPAGPLSSRQPPGPGSGGHEDEPIDWLATTLLFLFPALGGLLFGCGAAPLSWHCPPGWQRCVSGCRSGWSRPARWRPIVPALASSAALPAPPSLPGMQVRHWRHLGGAGVHDLPHPVRYRLVQPGRLPVRPGGQPLPGRRAAGLGCGTALERRLWVEGSGGASARGALQAVGPTLHSACPAVTRPGPSSLLLTRQCTRACRAGAALLWGDRLGRKRELLLASGLYGLGAATVALAPGGLPTVLAGRLAYGVGIGFAMHAAPAYIAGARCIVCVTGACKQASGRLAAWLASAPRDSLCGAAARDRGRCQPRPSAAARLLPPPAAAETSPPRVRGLLISLKEAFIVGGILAGCAPRRACALNAPACGCPRGGRGRVLLLWLRRDGSLAPEPPPAPP